MPELKFLFGKLDYLTVATTSFVARPFLQALNERRRVDAIRTLSLEIPVAHRRRYICNLRRRNLGAGTAPWTRPAKHDGDAATPSPKLFEAGVAFSQPDWTI
jgi:hypothetical protein